MPKTTDKPLFGPSEFRQQYSLEEDLVATTPLRPKSKKRKDRREDEAGDGFVDSKSSRKILKIGQELAEEDQEAGNPALPNTAFAFEARLEVSSSEQEDLQHDDEEAWGDEDEVVEEVVCLLYPEVL